MAPSRDALLSAARAFCDAFANKKDIDTLMSHFSETYNISAIEYGESVLAPFLGKQFTGTNQVRGYFEMIASLLAYENMTFSEYVVDIDVMKVSCKGKAKFTWLETGEFWDETFAYMLDFDESGKVTDYQVWADSGAAYLARLGNLKEVKVAAEPK